MNLLYYIGTRSGWDHNELRYSIRSVEKWDYVDSVTVAGYCPHWLRPTLHVPMDDPTTYPHRNVAMKLKAALNDPRCPSEFVLMCDDFYMVDVPDLRWRHCGLLSDTVARLNLSRAKSDAWRIMMNDLLAFLREADIPHPLSFATHTPFYMRRKDAIITVEASLSMPIGGDLMTLHAALHDGDIVKGQDAKNLWPRIVGPYISSGEHHESDANFRRWLAEEYPEPSRYEV